MLEDAHKRARVDTDSTNNKSVGGGIPPAPSVTTSHAGSGSEGHLGSEPPPTRQQRLSSTTSHQSDPHVSPVVSPYAFSRHGEDTAQAQLTINDKFNTRARGFSSPGSRETLEQVAYRPQGLHNAKPLESSSSYGFPPMAQFDPSRITTAPVSQSPDGGIPSIVPVRSEDARSSDRNSSSSQYWSRPPSLRTEQSSTNSISSLSSFAQPRTPSESSLPIHALLSSSSDVNPFDCAMSMSKAQLTSQSLTPTQQYPGRPPVDQYVDSRSVYSTGTLFEKHMINPRLKQTLVGVHRPSSATQLHAVPPLGPSLGQTPLSLPRINGFAADLGLDGMSALLRASDIVGRPDQ